MTHQSLPESAVAAGGIKAKSQSAGIAKITLSANPQIVFAIARLELSPKLKVKLGVRPGRGGFGKDKKALHKQR